MKKQTKKEIWYWMIIGVGILLILTIAYGARRDQSKNADTSLKDSQEQEVDSDSVDDNEEVPSDKQDDSQDSDDAKGGDTQISYDESQSGGEIGQSYLLENLELKSSQGNARFVVTLSPKNTKSLPKWNATQTDNKISLSLFDTSNFDIVTGTETYAGDEVISGKNQIRKVTFDSATGDQLVIDITTDKKRAYDVKKLSSPLRLVVEVY